MDFSFSDSCNLASQSLVRNSVVVFLNLHLGLCTLLSPYWISEGNHLGSVCWGEEMLVTHWEITLSKTCLRYP